VFDETALPVEMTGMSAEVRSQTSEVRLSWRTASEVDNAGWEVERREVGGQTSEVRNAAAEWMKLGFVEGAGTSSSPREYIFTDVLRLPIDDSRLTIHASRYVYRLRQLDRSGSFSYSHEVEVELGSAPREFTLGQNFPNPFNPSTMMEFTLAEDGRTSLKVYDLLGREVRTLVEEDLKAGRVHRVEFHASDLSSGVYIVRLTSGSQRLTRKLHLIK
jgi:hypothetical protein